MPLAAYRHNATGRVLTVTAGSPQEAWVTESGAYTSTTVPTDADVVDPYLAAVIKAAAASARVVDPGLVVSVGAYATATSSAQTTSGTARTVQHIATAASDLRLVFHNWANDTANQRADLDGAGDLVIRVALEVNGVVHPATANGARTVTIGAGGSVVFDPIAVEVAAGALVYPRVFVVSGSWRPNRVAYYAGIGGWTATTDLTAAGSATIPDATGFTPLIGPAAILGTPTSGTPAVLSVGDSIDYGAGDSAHPAAAVGINRTFPTLGGGGFMPRAFLAAGAGLLSVPVPGDTAQFFVTPANRARRLTLARHAVAAVCGYGRNDVSGGRTLAQIQADLLAAWALLARRRLPVWARTITPQSSSSDGWVTVGGQTTSSNNAVRVALNTWLRDGAPLVNGLPAAVGTARAARCAVYGTLGALSSPASGPKHPLAGLFEVADAVESARNSGLWKAATNVRTVNDGVVAAGGYVVDSASAAFTAADIGRTIIVPGAGPGGSLHLAGITGQNPTRASFVGNPTGTAIASGAKVTVADVPTPDGTHPSSTMHAAMAANVPVAAILASVTG